MADTGGENLQQDLGACRLRRGLLVELQRLTANADLEHAHCRFLFWFIFCRHRTWPDDLA
jgi:hypothetical protein